MGRLQKLYVRLLKTARGTWKACYWAMEPANATCTSLMLGIRQRSSAKERAARRVRQRSRPHRGHLTCQL